MSCLRFFTHINVDTDHFNEFLMMVNSINQNTFFLAGNNTAIEISKIDHCNQNHYSFFLEVHAKIAEEIALHHKEFTGECGLIQQQFYQNLKNSLLATVKFPRHD